MATVVREIKDFTNEPFTDFKNPENRAKMEAALEKVRATFGTTYPLIIGDREITDGPVEASINPAKPGEVIGKIVQATSAQALEAIEVADKTFESWRKVSVED